MSKLFASDRLFYKNDFYSGGISVDSDGKIENIFEDRASLKEWLKSHSNVEVTDFKDLILMPGLIDSHVHINEPGRTQWEGFETATKAAAAGGFSTIVDMPLNSIPPTTTVANLIEKHKATEGQIYVDVGFWGGIIPGNEDELEPLLSHGVVGFKCFLCPSGVEEFPNVTEADVKLAYEKLQHLNALIAFHAEKCDDSDDLTVEGDVREFATYLKTRPASLELRAIKMITQIAKKFKTVRTHIVHLSAANAIPIIQECRKSLGDRFTVETCHHYLTLCAENVPNSRVDFKCCPPIREERNQKALWYAIKNRDIDLVVSDHSPSTAEMKLLVDGEDYGNFMKSWGGISSVQFGLSLFWTHCQKHELGLKDMIRLMCEAPAKLCGFDKRKGKLAKGYDADFCVWDPEGELTITKDIIHFKNKATPYMDQTLKGLVHATIVRGNFAYRRSESNAFQHVGNLIK